MMIEVMKFSAFTTILMGIQYSMGTAMPLSG